ncbi:MAG: T9SS type A sorting domain-containing protein [Bacteroidota bacterium]
MMKQIKTILSISLILVVTSGLLFASGEKPVNSIERVDQIVIYDNQMMDPDESQNNSVGGTTRYGTKDNPGAEYIVRWCVNGGSGVGAENFMNITNAAAVKGAYGMELGMGEIPSNNCWLDIHRDGAAEGWDVPLDASGTEQVSFWVKADVGTAPFWFIAQSWADADAGATQKQYAVSTFVDGETVLIVDEYGDVQVLRDNPFDGEWQFVSIPWKFLKMTDQAAVEALLPWSSVWEGSADDTEAGFAFDEGLMRTIKWHTKPEGDQATIDAYGASADSKWGDLGDLYDTPGEWIIDEVRFLPPFDASGYKKEIKLYTNEMMDPDEGQNNSVGGTTRYGTKDNPGAENIVRWCVNGGSGVGAENYMDISGDDVADGPYAMKLGMGEIPSNNCWMDIHRDGAAEGWDIPLDASETDRVTFWLKADAGTAPFWFIAQSWADADAGATQKQYAVSTFVDGETVLIVDEYGDVQVLRDNPFDGEWQFVSIPWKFLKMTDQAAVEALLPWSSVWEGSADDTEAGFAFDEGLMRTIKWHTKPEGDQATIDAYGASADSKWGDLGDLYDTPGEWIIDEVVFTSAYEDGYDGLVGVEKEIVALPNTYKLGNAYPNPFNPTTNIKFAIPVSNNVQIDVYNIMGQKVRTLVNTEMNAGSYEVTWDAKNDNGEQVSTGIYFFHMKSSHYQATQKAILMK